MSDTLSKPTLPTFSWIGNLKEDDRDLLSSYGEFFPGHPGSVIIEEGSQQTDVIVVISGKLEVRAKQDDGSEIVLAQVGPGETLGEISLFNPGPAAATVTAIEFSQLWRINDVDLIHYIEENPGAGNLLLRTLCSILSQRLRQMNPRAFGLSTYAVISSPELTEQDEAVVLSEDTETTGAPILTPETIEELDKPAAPASVTSAEKPAEGRRMLRKTQPIPDPDEIGLGPI